MVKKGNKQICFNCRYRIYNIDSGSTECSISEERRDKYFTQWVVRCSESESCPFKRLDDGGEYIYWQ